MTVFVLTVLLLKYLYVTKNIVNILYLGTIRLNLKLGV